MNCSAASRDLMNGRIGPSLSLPERRESRDAAPHPRSGVNPKRQMLQGLGTSAKRHLNKLAKDGMSPCVPRPYDLASTV